MKKILAIVIDIAFAFGAVGYVAAETGTRAPAPKAEDKKVTEDKNWGDKQTAEGKKSDKTQRMGVDNKKTADDNKKIAPTEKK